MPADPITVYLSEIERQAATGRATEHTHRPALQRLIEAMRAGITATNEPTRSECGAPDFIVTEGQVILGYVEAKNIGADLDDIERSDQLERYFKALPNLILTDYLEFRLYQTGQRVAEARLARPGSDGKLRRSKAAAGPIGALFDAFVAARVPGPATPGELAARMAAIARLLREVIGRAFAQEIRSDTLHGQLAAFRQVLLHDLDAAQFADMYAQTIGYGLFAARCHHDAMRGRFSRETAVYDLPETNPFLRQMFAHIAGPALDVRLAWAVDHLTTLLDRTDMAAVLRDFGKRTRREDPVVHFYETFLAAYNPKLRETRGVYYTPEPVVSYIVRSVDKILHRDFGIRDGLACTDRVPVYENHVKKGNSHATRTKNGEVHRVLILDPAVGTGTFLHEVIASIHEAVCRKHGAGVWDGYVSKHLLPRLFGFELLMAPYAVAHMKLGIQLASTGYTFRSGERIGVYLTNTLEEAIDLVDLPLFAQDIAREANAAGMIKTRHPVMVVLGNPPYSGHSENKGAWIAKLMRGVDITTGEKTASYFEVDGVPIGERNPKWINDDYIKFIRFAQWRIERTGHGVLAFVSNHGYLDNPTFRGVRKSLMETFDDIYVLDLHGNSKKKERAPDGAKDENVFDIQQGVAIGIFIKHKTRQRDLARVRHAELWGVRETWTAGKKSGRKLTGGKYAALNRQDVTNTAWAELSPLAPDYYFIPKDIRRLREYNAYKTLAEIMPVNSVGIVSARDRLCIHWDGDELRKTLIEFASLDAEAARSRFALGDDARDWKISLAQADLRASGLSRHRFAAIDYRPFDMRWTYYTGQTRGFLCMPRAEVMHHMLAGENLALLTTRLTKDQWDAHCTRNIAGHKALSAYDITYLFPLYLYPKDVDEEETLEGYAVREEAAQYGARRRANLDREFVKEAAARIKMRFVEDGCGDLKKTFGPEDVFHYLYAVFHAPTFRSRYAEFLKIDFPRLPLTSDRALFAALCGIGRRLTALHLLEEVPDRGVSFPVAGSNVVASPRYAEAQQRVYINDAQYAGGVPKAVWEFHVGGYQVCHKWLKDRRDRALSYDEVRHYVRTLNALTETLDAMRAADEAVAAHGGWPLR